MAIAAVALASAGCATTPAPGAHPGVIPVDGVLAAPCTNLGTVVGQSEAKGWGSGSTSRDELVGRASADAMDHAAAIGATHIWLSPVTVREREGAPFSATLTGVAFRCP